MIKKDFSIPELMSMDPISGFSTSNSAANLVPALRNGASIGAAPGVGASSWNSYIESAYFRVGALNSAVNIPFMIPMCIFKHTFFANDRDVYYGLISYLRVYLGPLSKLCYMNQNNNNPTDATNTAYVPAVVVPAAFANVQNLTLYLAIEDNPRVHEDVIMKHRAGLEYMIPYTQSYKNPNSNNTQTISIQFDQSLGHTLKQVMHSPFNNNETLDLAYDCSNNGTQVSTLAGIVPNPQANQKTLQFYTQLNGRREQDITMDCQGNIPQPVFTDYMMMKRLLRQSMLENLNVYQYNWSWCSDYSNYGFAVNQMDGQDLIAGVPLTNTPLTFSFYGSLMTPNTYQHYTYATFMRKLILNGNGAVVA